MKALFVKTLSVSIVASCILSSCFGPTIDANNVPLDRQKENIYYIPSSSTIPSLHKKNDLTIGLNSSFASKISRTEFYAAYAPLDRLGIFASIGGGTKNSKVELMETSMAIGYFQPVSAYWHFETYGGFNKGYIYNRHYTGNSEIDITRYFIQPSISVHNLKNNVELAFVSRITTAHFKISDTSFNLRGERFSADQLNKIGSNPNRVFLEPGLAFRFGWPNILFNINFTTSAIIAGESFYRSTNCLSFGAIVLFNVSKKQSRVTGSIGQLKRQVLNLKS
jgi:hypothetical protein